MARIFCSMAGEGRGHATRVRAIVEQLRDEHDFTLFAPADAYEMLSKAYAETDIRVCRIPGLMFHYSRQRMDYLRTINDAASYLWQLNPLVRRLEATIRDEQPDLVITDFDPALPRAAQNCGVPYLSIDHQHFLVDCDLSSLPWRLRVPAWLMAGVVNSYYCQQATTVISSFYFPPVRGHRHNVVQTGVLLRPEVLNASPERGGHLLVYLRRFASPILLEALRRCGREVFIYGLGEHPRDGRLRFCPVNEHQFLEHLACCDALISNAGNQLIGEALYLDKPVLAIPEAKNFEQFINAHFLRSEGGGDWVAADRFDATVLQQFLSRIDQPRHVINAHRMNGLPQVLATIQRHLPVAAFSKFVDSRFQKVA